MNDCTLLVMSCDKYETAWYPFFELIKKYWPNHPRKIVLCTDKKDYAHNGLEIICLHNTSNGNWSDRVIQALNIIDTKYVMFSLEDFFLQGEVNQKRIDECYEYMETHPEVAQFRFKNCDNKEQIRELGEEIIPDFFEAGKNVIFRFDTQVALWNKDILLSYIVPNENPWEFETKGTERIKYTENKFYWYKFNGNPKKTKSLVMPYQMSLKSGYGISMSHWLWNNKKLFRNNDLSVDFSQLGVYNWKHVKVNLYLNKLYKCSSNNLMKKVLIKILLLIKR